MRAPRSAATQHAYAEDWRRFEQWCAAMACRALPADPLVVLFYLGHLAPTWRPARATDPPTAVTAHGEVCESPGLAPPTLARHLAAIAAHHLDAGHPTPTHDPRVTDLLESLRERAGDPVRRRVAPAVPEQLRALVAGLTPGRAAGPGDDRDPVASRDLAMILVGFSAALRPAQIAALTLDQVREDPDGAWIDVLDAPDPGRTDTDTGDDPWSVSTHIQAVGDDTCVVAAWRRWRAWLPDDPAGGREGGLAGAAGEAPAFRAIRRGRPVGDDHAARAAARARISPAALTERSVARIVSARAAEAGLPGHWTAGHLSRHDSFAERPPPDAPSSPPTGPATGPAAGPDTGPVFRLVYRSRLAIAPERRSDEIAAILAVARRTNTERRVTGALLVVQDSVVQALEGREDVVRDLFSRIAADPRHHSVTTLEARHLRARTFGRWSMAKIAAPAPADGSPPLADEIRESARDQRQTTDFMIATMRDDADPRR